MLKLIPLGGLGEIGLNMMVVEYKNTIFVIDAGVMFPEDNMLGVDYVIPDMSYLKQNRAKVCGIVLTHAHEDHIGALPYLLKEIDAPIFGTPFTLGIVRHKLEEHKLLGVIALHEVHPKEHLKIGPIELEFVRVSHSVVDGVGLIIRTPVGTIIHTGDFKIGYTADDNMKTDVSRFAQCGEEGVLALLSDSTNVEKEGCTISDKKIGQTLEQAMIGRKGRIIVAVFASNVDRIQQIVNIAGKLRRKIIFNGCSMEVSVHLAKSLGYVRIPESMEIDIDQLNDFSDDEIIMITTGSQGEPMSALTRMANGVHKKIKIQTDDTVILSSKFIPGNEKAIAGIINNLYSRGADVVYEKISNIHVSGHAFQEELKLMISLTKPKYFMPIHGEYRHLVLHTRLAESMGIPKDNLILAQNGQCVNMGPNRMLIQDLGIAGRVLIDGKGIGDVGNSVLRERRKLSEGGLVVVNMAFDEETGIILYGPEIVSRGFVFETKAGHLVDDAQCVILELVEEVGPNVPHRLKVIRTKLKTALREYFFFVIGRRPIILPFIIEV
jgi:ribonuclease J